MFSKAYFVHLTIEGISDDFEFALDEDDAKRFRPALRSWDGNETAFFVSTTPSGLIFAVSLSHIEYANVIWEPVSTEVGRKVASEPEPAIEAPDYDWEAEEEGVEARGIELIFPQENRRHKFMTEDYDLLANAFWNIEHGVDHSSIYQYCLDEDGEEVIFNSRKLALITAPSAWVDRGNRQIARAEGWEEALKND